MKSSTRRHFIFAAALTVATVLVAAANKPVKTGAKGNFQRTKNRIDALLGPRLKPDPLPEVIPNPFQLTEAPVASATSDQKAVEKLPVSSDDEMLLYYGASLRISGVVRIDDITHLVINQAPYKEGDTLTLKTKDGPVKLRVVTIAPGELTLGFNEATQVIKFKK